MQFLKYYSEYKKYKKAVNCLDKLVSKFNNGKTKVSERTLWESSIYILDTTKCKRKLRWEEINKYKIIFGFYLQRHFSNNDDVHQTYLFNRTLIRDYTKQITYIILNWKECQIEESIS